MNCNVNILLQDVWYTNPVKGLFNLPKGIMMHRLRTTALITQMPRGMVQKFKSIDLEKSGSAFVAHKVQDRRAVTIFICT